MLDQLAVPWCADLLVNGRFLACSNGITVYANYLDFEVYIKFSAM